MVKCGLDWSMSSPGLCITTESEILMYGQSVKKKDIGVYNTLNITINVIQIPKKWNNNSERFSVTAKYFADVMKEHGVTSFNLEGYSMGSRGSMAYTIGESTGFLKSEMFRNDIGINIISPTTLKKFATGKGNANKELMFESFMLKHQGVEMPPVDCRDDIIDAYWLSIYDGAVYESIVIQ